MYVEAARRTAAGLTRLQPDPEPAFETRSAAFSEKYKNHKKTTEN